MKLEYKEAINVKPGLHKGTISRVVAYPASDERQYEYTDVFIQLDDGPELKYGCPSNLSENSRLGMLMSQFVVMENRQEYDPKVLEGNRVEFMTENKETPSGIWPRIIHNTVKKI